MDSALALEMDADALLIQPQKDLEEELMSTTTSDSSVDSALEAEWEEMLNQPSEKLDPKTESDDYDDDDDDDGDDDDDDEVKNCFETFLIGFPLVLQIPGCRVAWRSFPID